MELSGKIEIERVDKSELLEAVFSRFHISDWDKVEAVYVFNKAFETCRQGKYLNLDWFKAYFGTGIRTKRIGLKKDDSIFANYSIDDEDFFETPVDDFSSDVLSFVSSYNFNDSLSICIFKDMVDKFKKVFPDYKDELEKWLAGEHVPVRVINRLIERFYKLHQLIG